MSSYDGSNASRNNGYLLSDVNSKQPAGQIRAASNASAHSPIRNRYNEQVGNTPISPQSDSDRNAVRQSQAGQVRSGSTASSQVPQRPVSRQDSNASTNNDYKAGNNRPVAAPVATQASSAAAGGNARDNNQQANGDKAGTHADGLADHVRVPITHFGKRRPKNNTGRGLIMFLHDYLSLKPALEDYYIGNMSILAIFLVVFISFSSAAVMTYFINSTNYQPMTISYANYYKKMKENPNQVFEEIKCPCSNQTLADVASNFDYSDTSRFFKSYLNYIYDDAYQRLLRITGDPIKEEDAWIYFRLFMQPIKEMFPSKVNMTRKITAINVAALDAFYGDTLMDAVQESTWMLQVPYKNLREDLLLVNSTSNETIPAFITTAQAISNAVKIQKVFSEAFFDFFYNVYDDQKLTYKAKTLRNILPGYDSKFEELLAKMETCGKVTCDYIEAVSALKTFQSCFTLAMSLHSTFLFLCSLGIKLFSKKIKDGKDEKKDEKKGSDANNVTKSAMETLQPLTGN